MATNVRIRRGSTLGSCHVVEDILGEGGFGVVAKCRNTETNKVVAVKVNKGEEGVLQSAIAEIAVLKRLRCLDPDTCNIVQWDSFFFDKENLCITFEVLDQSLRDCMLEQDTWGLTVGVLRPILHQMATALSHLHSIGIVHADLKPENIMIVDRHQHPMKIKLIDFGLARPVSAIRQGDCMGTLPYCSPEMLLGVPFNECIDMWALGQVMAELAMGCSLYPGNTKYDVLRFIVETQGQPPDDVLDRGRYTDNYFHSQDNGTSRWRFKTPDDVYYEHGFDASETRTVELSSLDEIQQNMEQDIDHRRDQKMFISLIKSMLILDASNRITAREVLEHQFFAPSLLQSSSRDADMQSAHTDNQGRHPNSHQAATSWEEEEDLDGQFPILCRAMSLPNLVDDWPLHSFTRRTAVSLEEHVNFNFQHSIVSQAATSWEEEEDFNGRFPIPYRAMSLQEHLDCYPRHSVPHRAAVSLEERVNFNFHHSVLSQAATSWEEEEDFNVRFPSPCGAAVSLPDHLDYCHLHSVPCRTAVSLEEHVNFNFQHSIVSQAATSWGEPEDFNLQFPTPPMTTTSQQNCVESSIEMMPTGDHDFQISHTEKEVLPQTPFQAATVGDCCPDSDSQTEDFTVEISHIGDEVLHLTPSSTATSWEQHLKANTRNEANTNNISWWRRILRKVTGAFRKYIS